jgi:hypothetical protein
MNPDTLVPPSKGEKEFDNQYSDCAQYGRIQFWDARYLQMLHPFEWYYPYEDFRGAIRENVPLDTPTFVVGCGTSHMPRDMIEDGYLDITAGDISRIAMSQQRIMNKGNALKFFQGTLLDTNIPAGSFGAIIDKALFDSILCSDTGTTSIYQYLFEVFAIIPPQSRFEANFLLCTK